MESLQAGLIIPGLLATAMHGIDGEEPKLLTLPAPHPVWGWPNMGSPPATQVA